MVLAVDERTFSQEVLGSPIPVLAHFWAPWCGVCRIIDPFLSNFQEEWHSPIKLVSINADENLKLANTYRLSTLPTLIMFSDGDSLLRFDGFRNRNELQTAVLEVANLLQALETQSRCPA